MTIALEHFCTKTGKPIIIDGKTVKEEIHNSVAEYLFPNVTFNIGVAYPGITTPEDLTKHEDKSLQFSKKGRLYFADSEGLREQVFDQPHFGAAYGSILFGECKYFKEVPNLRVLVVDDETGECGGVLPPEQALQLVGDGDGKIDNRLHEQLGNPEGTQFQVRGAIKAQEGVKATQLIKGTLAPIDLSEIGNGYDLILSKSQLGKGRKNQENQQGIIDPKTRKIAKIGNEMAPGEYVITIGLGDREDAQYRESSLGAQPLNCLPEGVIKDIVPKQLERLKELEEIAGDPRKLALDYIKTLDKRNQYKLEKETQEDLKSLQSLDLAGLDEVIDKAFGDNDQETIYKILKADLQGHFQVLETPKIVSKLEEHFQEQFRDCALGRFAKFKSAMAMSSRKLEPGEVCDPSLPDGEEIIIYRPPVGNSNVMAVLTNRHLEDEPIHRGSIKMHPQTQKLLKIDNDGDRPAYALAKDFPNLAAEIQEKTKEDNRYAEIVTPEKASYSGTFEEIALKAMEDKTGLVANMAMKAIAQENECLLIPEGEKRNFLKNLSENLANVAGDGEVYFPKEAESLKDKLRDFVELHNRFLKEEQGARQFDSISNNDADKIKPITPEEVQAGINEAREVFRNIVEILSNQLEIEVQSGKSANRSDQAVLDFCEAVCAYPEVNWLEDRNLKDVYLGGKSIKSNTHGPIDSLVQQANEFYNNNQLIPRPISQFHDLFREVNFTEKQQEQAIAIKKEYDDLIHGAHEIKNEIETNNGKPYLKIVATSPKGNEVEIILNEKITKHPQAFELPQMDIQLIRDDKNPNRWKANAIVLTENGEPLQKDNGQPVRKQLGYVSDSSARENRELFKSIAEKQNNQKFIYLGTLEIEIFPGFTKAHERAAFTQASKKAQEIYQSIPDDQKKAIAAAMWDISTEPFKSKNRNHEENREIELRRRTGAPFAIFSSEIAERLGELQFTQLSVVGTHKPSSEHLGRNWHGEKVPIKIELAPDPNPNNSPSNKRWVIAEGKKFAVFNDESPQLPTGTEAMATITSGKSASLVLTSNKGNQLKVGQLKKYAFADTEWKGEQAEVTIRLKANYDPNKPPTPLVAIDGKVLGAIDKDSFTELKEKLEANNIPVQGFKFTASIQPAPATVADIVVDPKTIRYPEEWTRDNQRILAGVEKQISVINALKPVLTEKYSGEKRETLLHDEDAIHRAIAVNNEFFVALLEDRGKEAQDLQKLSEEITDKFAAKCFIQSTEKNGQKELYFCVDIADVKKPEKITDILKFPFEYEAMKNGVITRFIAIPINELQQLISQSSSQKAVSEPVQSPPPLKPELSTISSTAVAEGKASEAPITIPGLSNFARNASSEELKPVLVQTDPTSGESAPYKLYVARNTIPQAKEWLEKKGVDLDVVEPETPGSYATIYIKSISNETLQPLTEKYPTVSEADFQKNIIHPASLEPFTSVNTPNQPEAKRMTMTNEEHNQPDLERLNRGFSNLNQPENESNSPQTPSSNIREEWEKKMLIEATKSLQASPAKTEEEIQTATFADGKYRAILHAPSETLHIVDETQHRGTIWKGQKGKPASVCQFTQEEKEEFLERAQERAQERQQESSQMPLKKRQFEYEE